MTITTETVRSCLETLERVALNPKGSFLLSDQIAAANAILTFRDRALARKLLRERCSSPSGESDGASDGAGETGQPWP